MNLLFRKTKALAAFASTLPYRFRLRQPALRYYFIHIPKNGGSAVRAALRWRGDVVLSEPKHYRYVDVANAGNRDLEFFSIIRNPWSRTASRYLYARKQSLKWPENDARRQYIRAASFEQFVRERRTIEIPAHPGQPWMGPLNSWFNQLEWVRDEDGQLACDCLRLEHLNTDVNDYFRSHFVLPDRKVQYYDYRSMYTDELAEIIADVFADDIEFFGFNFEGSATRNIAVGG